MQSLTIRAFKIGLAMGASAAASAMAVPVKPVTLAKPAPVVLSDDDLRVGAPAVMVAPPVAKPLPPRVVHAVAVVPVTRPVVAAKPLVVATPTPILKPVPLALARPIPPMPPQVRNDLVAPATTGVGYHRPQYGYRIPDEWTAANYYIADVDDYDLPRPAAGFGWSRYYDDAVLTDQWGRVYDWRDDVNWADHDTRYHDEDRRDGDRRDRTSRNKRYGYKGRWIGSWDGGSVQSYQGEWNGSVRPHWSGGYDGGTRGSGYGASYGYDGGGTIVTTVIVQTAPVMTTQTISYDEVSYVPVRAKAVRRWKPRPKPVCACGS